MAHQSDLIATDIEGYLKAQENKELLRFITCGSVDDGKSTLIGRLLHDSKMIFEDQLATLEKESKKSGTTGEAIDLALLVDGLQSEREQGITIDVAYRYFSTDKRKFIIADTPGHEQYTRNMATGASTAQAAIILIDARYGVVTQTRRHSYIVNLLGIRNVIVAVNKMDLVDYDQNRFDDIVQTYTDFAKKLGIETIYPVPLSALLGDNVVSRSEHTPWYQGETLMTILETIPVNEEESYQPFRFNVQYVNRPHLNFRGFAGTIASGEIAVGDTVKILPQGTTTKIGSIVTYDHDLLSAKAAMAVTLTTTDEVDISRGSMIVKADDHTIWQASTIEAHVVWMDETPLTRGKPYTIKRGSSVLTGYVDTIEYLIDVNTQEHFESSTAPLNAIAKVILTLTQPLAFDPYHKNRATGSFIFIDKVTNGTVGAGMIIGTGAAQISNPKASDFERELNALVRKHFPHWEAREIF